jgi:sterol desaturase/sphingolipid hydroxylase (fatty acid hydroxylase superfamily)
VGTALLAWEPVIRVAAFAGLLPLLMLLEAWRPRRPRCLPRRRRWPANLAIVALDTVAVRLLAPVLPVALALLAEERGWGLLRLVEIPPWAAFGLSVMLLDLAVWGQHLAFHKAGPLWRLHRMHHADQDIDVTTGARFHPLEILISLAVKLAVVGLLGPPAAAVLIFEVLLNAMAMVNHANLALPRRLDAILRLVVVTPDMHRVHHSWHRDETDSNYGFNFPWWDRLFSTYTAQPRDGHDGMTIGLHDFRTAADQGLRRMLAQPWRRSGPPAVDE